ncbi:virulence factor TspB C-terminal domain-related protein [Pseudomonas aeruginosa]
MSTGGGHSFTFSYKPLCAFASDLGVLIVVAASIFATLYVGRGFGGE